MVDKDALFPNHSASIVMGFARDARRFKQVNNTQATGFDAENDVLLDGYGEKPPSTSHAHTGKHSKQVALSCRSEASATLLTLRN